MAYFEELLSQHKRNAQCCLVSQAYRIYFGGVGTDVSPPPNHHQLRPTPNAAGFCKGVSVKKVSRPTWMDEDGLGNYAGSAFVQQRIRKKAKHFPT